MERYELMMESLEESEDVEAFDAAMSEAGPISTEQGDVSRKTSEAEAAIRIHSRATVGNPTRCCALELASTPLMRIEFDSIPTFSTSVIATPALSRSPGSLEASILNPYK
jgi:hypothetical protein